MVAVLELQLGNPHSFDELGYLRESVLEGVECTRATIEDEAMRFFAPNCFCAFAHRGEKFLRFEYAKHRIDTLTSLVWQRVVLAGSYPQDLRHCLEVERRFVGSANRTFQSLRSVRVRRLHELDLDNVHQPLHKPIDSVEELPRLLVLYEAPEMCQQLARGPLVALDDLTLQRQGAAGAGQAVFQGALRRDVGSGEQISFRQLPEPR